VLHRCRPASVASHVIFLLSSVQHDFFGAGESSSANDFPLKNHISERRKNAGQDVSEKHVMSRAKLNTLIFGLGLAIFFMALDMSILATAIPRITEKFKSTDDIGWYASGYMLTM
jgi:hypothetical protein